MNTLVALLLLRLPVTMSAVIRVEFTLESGLRKVDKLRLIASEIDNQYARLKADTGQKLNYECTKRPWGTSLHVTVEGNKEAVHDLLRRIRPSVDRLGVKGTPEHWADLA
jgi:hypothetical protein